MTLVARSVFLACVLTACGSQQPDGAFNATAANRPGAERPAAMTATTLPNAEPTIQPSDGTAQSGATIDRTNATGAPVLRQILLAAGTIDGQPITTFQLRDRCQMVLTSASGEISIDWRKVGNFAGRTVGNQRVIDLSDGSAKHSLGVPEGLHPEPLGNAAARVEGGLSVIADTCQS